MAIASLILHDQDSCVPGQCGALCDKNKPKKVIKSPAVNKAGVAFSHIARSWSFIFHVNS